MVEKQTNTPATVSALVRKYETSDEHRVRVLVAEYPEDPEDPDQT